MRNLVIYVCLFFSSSLMLANNNPDGVQFYKGNLDAAKEKAGEEGKLFFVDFMATWCTPCKWMDQTTFNDQDVISLLNDNYISLKVDIDEIDGYSMKQKYDIKYLPTILIFNSKGQLVDRVEETLSTQQMLKILKTHNYDENKVKVTHMINSSPRDSQESKVLEKYEENKSSSSRSSGTITNSAKKTNEKYRIQVGVYTDFKNTFHLVNELKNQFLEPIIVINDFEDNKMMYRVMMGEFKTNDEAEDFKNILSDKFNITGVVR